MGTCKYCGKDAGLLRSIHKPCEDRFNGGLQLVQRLAIDAIRRGINHEHIENKVSEFANTFNLTLPEVLPILMSAWDKAAENAISDNLLTKEEESRLVDLAEFFGADKHSLSERKAYIALTKAAVIRDICEGKMPKRIKVEGQLPIALQKDEVLLWIFQQTKYHENRTRTQYVGGSQGISVRVMRGVYYRVGAFKGEPIQTDVNVHVDTGQLYVTTKHLIFYGPTKSVRLKYSKIISYTPYSDGIGVCRDAVTAKQQSFITGDGWFTYNLIINASEIGGIQQGI